ncbi:hypothetical protein ACWEFL_26045 [Streptomyces sp. NPDC004838]
MATELWAHTLTWAEVDPSRHPFELDEDASKTLTGLVGPLLPSPEAADEDGPRSLGPPSHSSRSSVDPWHWERACTRLITVVADRTQAESGWYGHCEQVLGWFLACDGVEEQSCGGVFTRTFDLGRCRVMEIISRLLVIVPQLVRGQSHQNSQEWVSTSCSAQKVENQWSRTPVCRYRAPARSRPVKDVPLYTK